MEHHKTNKTLLFKGVKILISSLLSIILGPILLSFAYSKTESGFYYPLLIIGFSFCALAIFMIFKGIKTIMDSIFNK